MFVEGFWGEIDEVDFTRLFGVKSEVDIRELLGESRSSLSVRRLFMILGGLPESLSSSALMTESTMIESLIPLPSKLSSVDMAR